MVVDYLNNENLIDILVKANPDGERIRSHFQQKIDRLPKTQANCPCPFVMFSLLDNTTRAGIVRDAKDRYQDYYHKSRKIEVVNLDKVEAKAQDLITWKSRHASGADSAYPFIGMAQEVLAEQVLEDLGFSSEVKA
jgi:hypothetical protein